MEKFPGEVWNGHYYVPADRVCQGVTKKGKSCGAGPRRGTKYCPQHENQGSVAKSGEGSRLISERCEGSNPSGPTCDKHNEIKVLYGKNWKCKSCNREYQAKWFNENYEKQYERVRKNSERAQKAAFNFAWDYKCAHPCVDCGETDPVVLDFDHVDEKSFGVSSAISRGIRLDRIAAEMEKCEIRCANCHRRKTAAQLGWHRRIIREDG